MNPIRILVVEDDPDFQYLIRQSLAAHADLYPVLFCQDGETALRAAAKDAPDIVLMDLALTGGELEGVEIARRIRLETQAKVIILTAYENPATVIQASVGAFASAYVMKSQFSLLVPTIRETAQGATPQSYLICSALLHPLTAAEITIFQYMMGMPVALHSSPKTIANQQTSVLRKLGLPDKQALRHVFSAYFPETAAPTHNH